MKTLLTITLLLITFDSANAKFYEGNAKECPVLYKMSEWEADKTLDGREYWSRHQSWINNDGWIEESGDSFNFNPTTEKSYNIKNNPKNRAVLVYIGPWQKVTLTKGFLWNKETIETEIRMIASQRGRFLENHYEIKDEENSKIPEQRFVPLEESDDLIVKCDILRAQKWGYDSVLDGYINIFRGYIGKSPLSTNGKIINVYTKEVIADEKGNLLNPVIKINE